MKIEKHSAQLCYFYANIMNNLSKKSLFLSLLLFASLALIVSACVKKPVTPAANRNQNTNAATTTSVIDTSDWKTYKTKESGLVVINSIKHPVEFKYPKDWYITEGGGNILLTSYSVNESFREPDYDGEAMISFDVGNTITNQAFISGKPIDVWCKEDLLSAQAHYSDPEKKNVDILARGHQEIDGQLSPFLVYQWRNFAIKTRTLCFFAEDEVGVVSYNFIGEGKQEIYDMIISSILFD